MTCDATATDELYAGSDWVWSWTTTDDISGWSDPVVKIRAEQYQSSDLLFSSEGDDITISFDGGLDGAVPATDFDEGVFTYFVAAADTAAVVSRGSRIVYVEVRAMVDGVDTIVSPAQAYTVKPQVADREEVGS